MGSSPVVVFFSCPRGDAKTVWDSFYAEFAKKAKGDILETDNLKFSMKGLISLRKVIREMVP